jgi:hypothetical protein
MVPLLYKPPKSKLNILKFVTNHFFLLQEKNENVKIISFLCSKIILGTDDIILRTAELKYFSVSYKEHKEPSELAQIISF